METKTVERTRTEEGCNVRTVTHEDGAQDITLDTGRFPVLRIVGSLYDHKAEYEKAHGRSWST